MSVRRKLSSPNGNIPLWIKIIIIMTIGIKKAAKSPSPGRIKDEPDRWNFFLFSPGAVSISVEIFFSSFCSIREYSFIFLSYGQISGFC
jgi:hypothetical protein